MLKIAFCDDQQEILKQLCSLTESYMADKSVPMEYTAYQSPMELMAKIEKGTTYDILFLDILMCRENGIQVAKEVREFDQQVKIIFLTSTKEYAVQSYQVKAAYYQLKPIQKADFTRILDELISDLVKEKKDYLVAKSKSGITKINIKQLEYCEVINRTMYYHLTSGKEFESSDRIEEVQALLSGYVEFIRPHRSFLVNMNYIQNITTRSITLESLVIIPIPHGKYTQIKNTYLEYLFEARE